MKNQDLQWQTSLYSDGSSQFVQPTQPKFGDAVEIKLRVFKKNSIKTLFLRTIPDGEEILTPMKIDHEDQIFQWWRVKISVNAPVFNYRFVIFTEEQIIHYNQEGWFDFPPADDADFKIIADYKSPDWLLDRVFYQIFPDRFRDGDPTNNVKTDEYEHQNHHPIARKWGENPDRWETSHSMDFFGGDLAGIQQSVNYFLELGVNALYLNPIFQAPSNHKYDTLDYFKIDPHFGTNEEFAKLVNVLHQNDIRLILDGVFNHTGIGCEWFVQAQQALTRGLPSKYIDYYSFYHQNPENYHCWLGVKSLPVLNFQAEVTRREIYKDDNSVAKFWLKSPYHADGWRLDVANILARNGKIQLHSKIWREFRQEVRSANSEAYIMGEHFFDPSEVLQGDMLDGVMNYIAFTKPVREWLSGQGVKGEKVSRTAKSIERQMRQYRSRIGWQIALNQYNLLNSHDVIRLNGIIDDYRRNQLAMILLLTYLGVPSIYYGEEIGLSGPAKHADTDRVCMEWDRQKWDQELWEMYRQLITLRKRSLALQQGSLQTLYVDDDQYAYCRFFDKELYIIIVNNGQAKSDLCLPVKLVGLQRGDQLQNVLTHQIYTVTDDGLVLDIDELEGLILERV